MQKILFTEGDTRSFEQTVALEMQNPIKHFERELATIRTGRASTKLIEGIMAECYGQKMPLRDVATLSTPDPRLLTVQPWDKNLINDIEKALLNSDIGITPVNDGEIIRLQLPQMSSARREELIKLLGKKTEECRVGVRAIRKEAQNQIKAAEKAREISEDFVKRLADSLEKVTKNTIQIVDEISEKKSTDIRVI